MRILAIDAAMAGCSVAILADGVTLAEQRQDGGRGQAALLPPMVGAVLTAADVRPTDLDGIAVTVGPGSFTGLRAALALAHGLALSAGRPVVGVTVAEALAEAAGPLPGRVLWTAIDSRRDRLFLDIGGRITALAPWALPAAHGPVAVAGDAAATVAAALAARGDDVLLTETRTPLAGDVARVGQRRLAGLLPALSALPLYVDPPEAKLPAGGLRAAPAGIATHQAG